MRRYARTAALSCWMVSLYACADTDGRKDQDAMRRLEDQRRDALVHLLDSWEFVWVDEFE